MDENITHEDYKYLFTTVDCMGEKVALKKGTFAYKIAPKHPEVTQELIQCGVEEPHWILQDPDHEDRLRYYKFIPSPIQGRNDIINLKVVVETNTKEYNEVVTTYLLRNLKGEEIISGGILYDSSIKRVRRI
jgi:hypothetical protein